MADEHVVSADALRIAGAYLDAPKAKVREVRRNFEAGLNALGEPWGDDEAGLYNRTVFNESKNKIIKLLKDIEAGLDNLRENHMKMARNYETTEEVNKQ